MFPISHIRLTLSNPFLGLVAASQHAALRDVLNGYCLFFYTTPKAFIK